MKTDYIDYQDGVVELEAYVAWDETSDEQRPLVIVAHDWSGRREFACSVAERLAENGYIGFALDMYGKGVFGKDDDTEGNSALLMPFASNRGLTRQRALAALKTAKQLPRVDKSRVAVIGYCFGGMVALELARAGTDLQGVISIHGLLGQGELPTEQIIAKVLCLHGHDDPMGLPSQVLEFENEMSEAGADWQMHVFGGAKHAFTNPAANDKELGTVFNDRAAARTARAIDDFLQELFG
jgi:dienelactone hydrolase